MVVERYQAARFTPPLLFFLLLSLLIGCASIPFDYPRTPSSALYRPEETSLGRMSRLQAYNNPGASGFYLLPSGEEAFLARIFLIDRAEKTLDLQYYIFHDDLTGKYLLDRLIAAAERGVRVRILIDDWCETAKMDWLFAALEISPNIEVRIFNPFGGQRSNPLARPLQMVFGAKRLRGRMHNKAFIADNSVAIVGGRNIGDEYFGVSSVFNFQDLDILAQGPVTRQVSASFDDYWNCVLSVPIKALVVPVPADADYQAVRQGLKNESESFRRSTYGIKIWQNNFLKLVETGRLPYVWAPAELLSDDPLKCIDSQDRHRPIKMARKLQALIEKSQSEVLMISPYFVPRKVGMRLFREMRGRGITMKVITNSLASTDAPQAHIGYMHYRKNILWLGVDLYELRPKPEQQRRGELAQLGGDLLQLGLSAIRFGAFIIQLGGSAIKLSGPSREALHAKTLILDRQTVFVGSFNLDPRSVRLDTQNVIVISSPELAAHTVVIFVMTTSPTQTYRVTLREGRRLVWITEENGRQVHYHKEPMVKPWRRFCMRLDSFITPESVL